MEAMAAISAQTGPSERRRARTRRATLNPFRGADLPLDADHFTPFHFTPVQRRPVQRRPSRSRRRRTATE